MISKSDERLFTKARQAALQSDYHREHVGCIAVYQGKIIGVGYNSEKHIQFNIITTSIEIMIGTNSLFQNFTQKSTALIVSVIWILISKK